MTCGLGRYVVLRDVPQTCLRKGQEFTAMPSEWFSVKTITLGWTVLDPRYFDFMLSLGYIDRLLPEQGGL